MDLQSIATESQTLRSTIRDLRSVIATDKERLERHEGELKAALLRLDELESEAQVAFAAIRAPVALKAEEGPEVDFQPARKQMGMAAGGGCLVASQSGQIYNYGSESIFGEPEQQSAA